VRGVGGGAVPLGDEEAARSPASSRRPTRSACGKMLVSSPPELVAESGRGQWRPAVVAVGDDGAKECGGRATGADSVGDLGFQPDLGNL
jgi:hypothetical protein